METETIKMVIAIILGVYEVVARVIPTVNDWSLLGNVIKFIKLLSDFFNSKKDK